MFLASSNAQHAMELVFFCCLSSCQSWKTSRCTPLHALVLPAIEIFCCSHLFRHQAYFPFTTGISFTVNGAGLVSLPTFLQPLLGIGFFCSSRLPRGRICSWPEAEPNMEWSCVLSIYPAAVHVHYRIVLFHTQLLAPPQNLFSIHNALLVACGRCFPGPRCSCPAPAAGVPVHLR